MDEVEYYILFPDGEFSSLNGCKIIKTGPCEYTGQVEKVIEQENYETVREFYSEPSVLTKDTPGIIAYQLSNISDMIWDASTADALLAGERAQLNEIGTRLVALAYELKHRKFP